MPFDAALQSSMTLQTVTGLATSLRGWQSIFTGTTMTTSYVRGAAGVD